jgi:hypothetical protein
MNYKYKENKVVLDSSNYPVQCLKNILDSDYLLVNKNYHQEKACFQLLNIEDFSNKKCSMEQHFRF